MHRRLIHHTLFTNRAAVIKTGQIAQTVRMDRVAAGQILRGEAGGVHVFTADGAGVFVLVLEAAVCFVEGDGDAHAAFVAVSEVGLASYAAEAAFVAVEGFFG